LLTFGNIRGFSCTCSFFGGGHKLLVSMPSNRDVTIELKFQSGATPMSVSYNDTSSLVRFENNFFVYFEKKRFSLLQRWRSSCKF
jgi:hypothetical protein